MQVYWVLMTGIKGSENKEYSAFGKFNDDLSYFSKRNKLKGADDNDWWEGFTSRSKNDYLMDLDDVDDADPEVLKNLPDEKQLFTNYDDFLNPLNALLYLLTDDEVIEEELDGEDPMSDDEFLFHPDNLKEVTKELESIKDEIKLALESNAGFCFEMQVDY